jgi:hypothetical protein
MVSVTLGRQACRTEKMSAGCIVLVDSGGGGSTDQRMHTLLVVNPSLDSGHQEPPLPGLERVGEAPHSLLSIQEDRGSQKCPKPASLGQAGAGH